eukprot:GHVT01028068.1.p1 GENE.GHVT01028068.1~~GHVT01028068.1.p1  ORF type:complete len:151 (-),score=24.55 GHVT01028068.1:89-541(-)
MLARQAPLLKHTFSIGPMARPGDDNTVNMAKSEFAVLDAVDPRRSASLGSATWGPSCRLLMTPGRWSASRWTVPSGVSGWVGTAHYADQLQPLLVGETRRMPWEDADIQAATMHTMTLTPPAGGGAGRGAQTARPPSNMEQTMRMQEAEA